jgi:hypothetical protein
METVPPTWTLRRPCPVCEQEGLVLVACPGCGHLVAVCDEHGSAAFFDVHRSSSDAASGEQQECPRCHGRTLSEFTLASSDQIVAAASRRLTTVSCR